MGTIDAHVHQWDVRRTPREASTFVKVLGWNRPLMHWVARRAFPAHVVEFFGQPDALLADYLPDDYRADAGGEVEGFVHVEASWRGTGPLAAAEETRWLESLDAPRLKAIVGFADLTLGDAVADVLTAHMEASDRFRGVRYALAHHPRTSVLNACEDPAQMDDPTWRRGYAQLGEHGLSFDATVYHHQLDQLGALARDFPDVEMIVCHAGTPVAYGGPFGGEGASEAGRDRITDDWRSSMGKLAELPNVTVKISGLAMPIVGWNYHDGAGPDSARVARDFRPIVDFLIDVFGADRCMFGSNFPIDGASMPWATLHDALKTIVGSRSAREQEALFRGTAARVYRIETSGAADVPLRG